MKTTTTHHVEPGDEASFRRGSFTADYSLLDIGGQRIYLNTLGDDLGPWLLALSDAAAEFAREVGGAPVESQPEPVGGFADRIYREPGTSPYYVAPDAYGTPCIWITDTSGNAQCVLISPFGAKNSQHHRIWRLITAAVDAAMSPEARARRDEAVAS